MKTLKITLLLAAGLLCLNCFAATNKTKPIRFAAKSAQPSGCREIDCSNCSFDDESCEECCATTKPVKKSSSSNDKIGSYDGSKD